MCCLLLLIIFHRASHRSFLQGSNQLSIPVPLADYAKKISKSFESYSSYYALAIQAHGNWHIGICNLPFIQPGKDSLGHGLPAELEHTVMCYIRNDHSLCVIRPCRSFNLLRSDHIISCDTQDE